MPFATSTILFLLWFFVACFVLSPYKLLQRVSINSFQVLVSHHPAIPGGSHSAFSRQTLLHLPMGQHPGSPENGRLVPTMKKSSLLSALGCSTQHYCNCFPMKRFVFRESALPTRCRRGPRLRCGGLWQSAGKCSWPRGLQKLTGFSYSLKAAWTVSLLHR